MEDKVAEKEAAKEMAKAEKLVRWYRVCEKSAVYCTGRPDTAQIPRLILLGPGSRISPDATLDSGCFGVCPPWWCLCGQARRHRPVRYTPPSGGIYSAFELY